MSRRRGLWRVALATAGAGAAVTALALAVPAAQAAVTTLYVGKTNCADTGTGTAAQPYCTIGRAATVVVAGQTVEVAAGTYAEKVTVANSGTATAPIVFRPATGAAVTVTGAANGFFLSGKSYVTLTGFTVTGTTSYGIALSASNNITVSNNTVTGAGQQVKGLTAAGIYLSGTTASTVAGNTADRNSDSGIVVNATSSGNTVRANEASLNANGYQRNANGINVVGSANTVVANVTHDNEDSGIQVFSGANNNLVTLNVTYNNGDHGIDTQSSSGGRFVGNTVYHNCTTGINVEGASASYVVENNVAVDNAVYPAYNGISCTRRAGNIGVWDAAPATTTADANLVHLSTSGVMYAFGTAYTSLAAMRSASGQESRGLQASPMFAGAGTGNLRLTEGSPAIDSADANASGEQAADLTGTARLDDPNVANTGTGARGYDDRGAYEFIPAVPQPPTAALKVAPATGTAPLDVTADATGSADPQGQALSYTFAFGDGTAAVGPQPGATAPHRYAAAGSYTVTVTVTDTSRLTATATAAVTVSAPAGGGTTVAPAYLSPIGTNYSTSSHSTGTVSVWRPAGVPVGHAAVLTVALTGAAATGTVAGTDDAGNTYTVAADVADGAGDRLVVLTGTVRTALVPGQKITVRFPTAATFRITADELSTLTAVDATATAAGSGTAFAVGPTPATGTANELVVAAVADFAGTAPTWGTGWTVLPTYAVGSNNLGRGYRNATATGTFTASGTASGPWLATCVTLR